MKKALAFLLLTATAVAWWFLASGFTQKGQLLQDPISGPLITGVVLDHQGQPVSGARVILSQMENQKQIAESKTQPNGRFTLLLDSPIPADLSLEIAQAHYHKMTMALGPKAVQALQRGTDVELHELILTHAINLAFWIASGVFIGVLALIAFGRLHNTLSALLGTSILLLISYLGRPLSKDLFIFEFPRALQYVDWNVIFLILGMMIVVAVVDQTGIFQWLSYQAFRASHGQAWLLLPILMLITGVASAFLDNVTTMLLMTPISVEIGIAMGIRPLALLLPKVFASNLVGISTLIGTPTNIMIGSYAHISFGDFLVNLTPGVFLALVGLILYCEILYWRDLHPVEKEAATSQLIQRLKDRARITEPEQLRKAGIVGGIMLILFIFSQAFQLMPAVIAMVGATALLVWIRPDVEEMIDAVDWTTLVFFIGLFIVVGAVQEVGLISIIADFIGQVVGTNLILTVLVITVGSAVLSTLIANIPFTAAMLPVVRFLSTTVPGANSKVLFYCLSVGSAMGGNGSLIGASANLVMAGIAEQAGYPVTYMGFLRKGFPAMLLTVGLATFWILLRFGITR